MASVSNRADLVFDRALLLKVLPVVPRVSTFEKHPIAYDRIEGCHHLVSLRRKFERYRAIRSFAFTHADSG
jgi:hypothetical protein